MMKRSVAIVVGLLVIALIGCTNPLVSEDEESEDNGEPQEPAESVSFEPAGGTHNEDISVTLSSETDGATIYYSTDGSEPDGESSEYTDAIEVAGHGSETTIKAIAVADGFTDSSVVDASYVVDYLSQVGHRDMVSVPGGTFTQEDTTGDVLSMR